MPFRRLKKDVIRFLHAPVGRRFEARYRCKRRDRPSIAGRAAWCACGVLLVLVGVFFMIFPGPGIPIVAAGLACIAQESLALARWCDRTEVLVRSWIRRWRAHRARAAQR